MKTANKITLQQHFYYDLRERFSLSAQMAAICIRHVGGTYSRDKSLLPVFRPNAAMPYDSRILSFKGIDRVSLLTLEGRVIVPFVMGKYQRERFSLAKGQCDLVRRKAGGRPAEVRYTLADADCLVCPPQRPTLDRVSPAAEICARRMETLSRLCHPASRPRVVLTTINAATQRLPAPAIRMT